MATSNNSLHERMAEARATAEASMIARILNDLAIEPSTKRFIKSRGARVERWLQLQKCAADHVNGLIALAKVARRSEKPAVNGTGEKSPEELAAAAEYHSDLAQDR